MGESVEVSVDVKNVGERYGGEVVQLYVGAPKGEVFAPCCELRGFKKLYLLPKEAKNVNITLQKCDFSYYNTMEKRYAVLGGNYEISFRSSAEEAILSHSIYIDGDGAVSPYSDEVVEAYSGDVSLVTNEIFEKMSGLHIPTLPPVLPITMDSRFSDLKATFMGRLIYRGVMIMPNSHRRRAMRLPEGAQRDNMLKGAEFLRRVLDSGSLISMSMSSGGVFGYNLAEGMMYIANGRIFKGIFTMLKPISAPPLPKQDKLV